MIFFMYILRITARKLGKCISVQNIKTGLKMIRVSISTLIEGKYIVFYG